MNHNKSMTKLIKPLEINEKLIKEDLSFLLLYHSEKYKSKKAGDDLIFTHGDEEIVFTSVKGISLEKYLNKNQFKEEILKLFNKISKIEQKHILPAQITQECAPYSEKLPNLYKQLEKQFWLVKSASSTQAVEEFFVEINTLLSQSHVVRPKIKIR